MLIKNMSRNKTRALRMASMAVVAILIVIGALGKTGTGSLSAFGVKDISTICPLGYLETALASRTIMPPLLIIFFLIVGLTVLLGRIFCGWICPIPLMRGIWPDKTNEKQKSFSDTSHPEVAASMASEIEEKKDSSFGLPVLGVTLVSSAIFGFPVFCLICPIGLIFATLFALMRLFQFNEPTFDLIVFPIVIVVELVFLKKWCSKWCPVGALLGLFSRFNRTFVPTVDRSLCLEENHSVHCQQCRSTCSFDIDLKNNCGTGDISDCTKCRECAAGCPGHAIQFTWRRGHSPGKLPEPGKSSGQGTKEFKGATAVDETKIDPM